MTEILDLLLKAPDSQLDESMFELIKQFSSPPKALELLEVIDKCVCDSLASGFVLTLLEAFYMDALEAEGKIHEEVIKDAIWRDELYGT